MSRRMEPMRIMIFTEQTLGCKKKHGRGTCLLLFCSWEMCIPIWPHRCGPVCVCASEGCQTKKKEKNCAQHALQCYYWHHIIHNTCIMSNVTLIIDVSYNSTKNTYYRTCQRGLLRPLENLDGYFFRGDEPNRCLRTGIHITEIVDSMEIVVLDFWPLPNRCRNSITPGTVGIWHMRHMRQQNSERPAFNELFHKTTSKLIKYAASLYL